MATKTAAIVPVGTIFACQWGYEQTNVDFYEVVAIHGQSVQLRQNATTTTHDNDMTGHVKPTPGEYLAQVEGGLPDRPCFFVTKRPYIGYDGRIWVKSKYGAAWVWEGKPMAYSTYG